jgi:N-acetylmuramoyl-L-alanine amidase
MGIEQTDTNLDVAIRENSVIMMEEDYETNYQGFDPQSVDSYIIFSLMANTFQKQSIEFASYVQTQFRDRAVRKDRGVKQQPLYVLANSSMPGVLIETGFISNESEEKYLMSNNGQDIIASAVYRAFKQYKSRIEENSNFTVLPPAPEPEILITEIPEEKTETETNQINFLIQIVSSKNLVTIEPSAFKGYKDVRVFESGRWYKYALGSKLSYYEALDKCSSVKNDFPGAFVIAIKNNEIITLSEALQEINR